MERSSPNRPVAPKTKSESEKDKKELDEALERANELADKAIDEMSQQEESNHK